MATAKTIGMPGQEPAPVSPPADPCIMVIFGASGDLTKRLLMPALYNLLLDGLLPERFAIVGIALDELSTEDFRARMSKDIRQFNTRTDFDEKAWDGLCARLHYMPGNFGDEAAFAKLYALVAKLE